MNIVNLHSDVKIVRVNMDRNALRQWITYSISFRESTLKVTVYLDYNSSRLNFIVECDWQEKAQIGKCIPQLNFHMPVGYACKAYKYDIPFGTIIRDGLEMDVPANSWAQGIPEGDTKSQLCWLQIQNTASEELTIPFQSH